MSPVFAYLDAGSGALLLQLVIGGAAGVLAFIKLGWRRLVGRETGASEPTAPVEALEEAGDRSEP